MSDESNALAPYKFHGIDFRHKKGKEAVASCPFGCTDDAKTGQGHFFVNEKTGQCACKKCGFEGNSYTFLQEFHRRSLAKTKKTDWETLASNRKLPWTVFKDKEVALDQTAAERRWLIPVTNGNASLANLLAFIPSQPEPKAIGTSGCAMHLGGAANIRPTGPIYICEGPWDEMALTWMFGKVGIDPGTYSVVWCPGSAAFKKDWAAYFKGRDAVILFDNDKSGRAGTDKIKAILTPVAASIRNIVWPANFPEKYDIRDLVVERITTPKIAYKALLSFLPKLDHKPTKKLRQRTTFQSVVADFRKEIQVSQSFIDALAVCMAVVISAPIHSDPLWGFLVGPPSSGKTLLIHSFLNLEDKTHYLSHLTRPALVSGYKLEDGEDPSVLPTLRDKCLFIEDYTTVKSLPLTAQDELYGLLRAVYNGKYDHPFGNMESRSYNDLYFSMIAGVTNIIYRRSHSLEGERFIKLSIGKDIDRAAIVRRAIGAACGESPLNEEFLREIVAAYVTQLPDVNKLPKVPGWFVDRMVALAQICSILRALVEWKDKDELMYRPDEEVGARLAKQLVKIAQLLALVFQHPIDQEIYRLIQRIAFDTVAGFNVEVADVIAKTENGAIIDEIGHTLQLSHSTISRRLHDLQELRMIYKHHDIDHNQKGQPRDIWNLTPEVRELWTAAAIEIAPPKLGFKIRRGYKKKISKPKPSISRKAKKRK